VEHHQYLDSLNTGFYFDVSASGAAFATILPTCLWLFSPSGRYRRCQKCCYLWEVQISVWRECFFPFDCMLLWFKQYVCSIILALCPYLFVVHYVYFLLFYLKYPLHRALKNFTIQPKVFMARTLSWILLTILQCKCSTFCRCKN